MVFSTVEFLHFFDHGSEPEHKIDSFPLPVADPDANYKPIVDLWSPMLSLPANDRPQEDEQEDDLGAEQGATHKP